MSICHLREFKRVRAMSVEHESCPEHFGLLLGRHCSRVSLPGTVKMPVGGRWEHRCPTPRNNTETTQNQKIENSKLQKLPLSGQNRPGEAGVHAEAKRRKPGRSVSVGSIND